MTVAEFGVARRYAQLTETAGSRTLEPREVEELQTRQADVERYEARETGDFERRSK